MACIALHQLFDIVLQQWADHDAGAILLNLRQDLIQVAVELTCRRFSAPRTRIRWWWPLAVVGCAGCAVCSGGAG
jgi:hypothetical protein